MKPGVRGLPLVGDFHGRLPFPTR